MIPTLLAALGFVVAAYVETWMPPGCVLYTLRRCNNAILRVKDAGAAERTAWLWLVRRGRFLFGVFLGVLASSAIFILVAVLRVISPSLASLAVTLIRLASPTLYPHSELNKSAFAV